MTETKRISDADQAVTAVCSLVAAVALGFVEAGQVSAANKMMDMFEGLNKGLLPPGHILGWLQMPVDAHREQLKAAGLDK